MMWLLSWMLYIIIGVVCFYALVILPLVLLYSAVFPQMCLICKQRKLKYLKFVLKDPDRPQDSAFVPRAYYRCKQCNETFKLERGDWFAVPESEVEQMIR